jgi:hypothetical protein
MSSSTIKRSLLLLAFMASANAEASCGSAFCTASSDWDVQGVWSKPGIRLDLREEFIDLDQLRHGSHKTGPSGEVDEHDEKRTINRNTIATLDWSINEKWGLTLRVPYSSRSHTHVHNEDDGAGGVEPEVESWNFKRLGDVQAIARYAFYQTADSNAGLRLGLKLPTGQTSIRNADGEKAERSLQPGSGSVDGIVGAYFNQRLKSFDWFTQASWQQSMSEHDHFKPGSKLALDTGLSYALTPDLNVLLQVNLLHKRRDEGSNAEPDESGGDYAFLTPGLSYRLTGLTRIYGFVQQPLYQHVNGTQLTADWSAAFGISTQF